MLLDSLLGRMARSLLAAALLVLAIPALAETAADAHANVRLISEQAAIVPDKELWVGLLFDLEDGWHTYWVNPGDSGEAPRIDWELPAGFQAGQIQWPYPKRLSTPPFVDYGYEHEVLLMVPIRPARGQKGETSQMLSARVHYLVCRDVCIPAQKRLALTLPVGTQSVSGPDAKLFAIARGRLPQPVPANWRMSAISRGEGFRLRLGIGRGASAPQFFPLDEEEIENAAPQDAIRIPGGFLLDLKKSNHLLKPISHIRGVLVVASGNAYAVDIPVSRSSG
jgi:DsbC/DsbD-like thiol-disulfide interchange protein